MVLILSGKGGYFPVFEESNRRKTENDLVLHIQTAQKRSCSDYGPSLKT